MRTYSLRVALLSLSLVLLGTDYVEAFDVVPEVDGQVMVENFCYDTPRYYQEVNRLNAEQGHDAARNRYWAIMSTSRLTACHASILWPVTFARKVSETPDLRTPYGRCFTSQVWEVKAILGPSTRRKMFSSWHVACSTGV